jgi:hypothetical protein
VPGQTQPRPAGSAGERGWLIAAGIVAGLAVAARIHNAFAFPPLHDFDGPGHALSVFALYQGRLPDPHAWSGFHPPLYYAAGAGLWHLLPASMPVHATLRLLSAAAGLAAVAITWRALRRFVSPANAAVTAALALSVPVVALATSMLGNETSCALFATAALARLLAFPVRQDRIARHVAETSGLAALAALSKSTGLLVVGVTLAAFALRLRHEPRRALAALLVAIGIPALLLAPHYGRLVLRTGSLRAVMSGGVVGAEHDEMQAQPPGERRLADYALLPAATFAAPFKDAPGMVRSVPGLLWASLWADGHGQFLPADVRAVVGAAALSSLLGLLPTGVALLGALRLARRRSHLPAAGPAFAYGALLTGAFLLQTWIVPRYSAVKASYLLSAMLPAALCFAVGLGAARGRANDLLRALALAIALYATGLTWYGWWT